MIKMKPPALATLSLVLTFGLAACGSSSSSSGNGGKTGAAGGAPGAAGGKTGAAGGKTGAAGGATGSTGGIIGSPGGTTGTCDIPPCLAGVTSDCMPAGTCVEQMTTSLTGGTDNVCYSNGVKQLTTTTLDSTFTSFMFTSTVTKAGATCFTLDGALNLGAGGAAAGPSTFTIKNGAGATVATETVDPATGTVTINCGGQSYDVTNSTCGMPMGPNGGGQTDCTTGACQ